MSVALDPRRVEAALWLALWAGLAGGVGLEIASGRHTQASAVGAQAEFSKPALAQPFRLAEADEFLTITTRPLFVVTRKPAPIAPPPEPPKPSMKKDQFILMGTTLMPEGKFAFLLEKAGNKNLVAREGTEVNGIKVKEVRADRVLLTQYDDSETLILKMNKPPPGAAQAAPGAAQGQQPGNPSQAAFPGGNGAAQQARQGQTIPPAFLRNAAGQPPLPPGGPGNNQQPRQTENSGSLR